MCDDLEPKTLVIQRYERCEHMLINIKSTTVLSKEKWILHCGVIKTNDLDLR